MSVRLREWTTASGQRKQAWIVDYLDGEGKRRLKTFPTGKGMEKAARDFEAKVRVDIKAGTHVPDSQSVSVLEAGTTWLERIEALGREPGTIASYRSLFTCHIEPTLGKLRLTQLDMARIARFEDDLLRSHGQCVASRSLLMLSMLLADAQSRGLVSHNVVRERPRRRGQSSRSRLEVGRDIPSIEDIRLLISHSEAAGWYRPIILTAIFSGLRASELRGLRWEDIDLKAGRLSVRQRADIGLRIGRLKSRAGSRTVPLTPMVVNTLKEWKLRCPPTAEGTEANGQLAFPNKKGEVMRYMSLTKCGLHPLMKASFGMVKYSGMHSLRHWYASWLINREIDGGLGLPPKIVQERMGHATLAMTMDVYGHLFPREEDSNALAAAELRLIGAAGPL